MKWIALLIVACCAAYLYGAVGLANTLIIVLLADISLCLTKIYIILDTTRNAVKHVAVSRRS